MTRSGMEGVALDRRVSPVLVGCEESQTITKEEAHEPGSAHATDLLQRERGRPGEDA